MKTMNCTPEGSLVWNNCSITTKYVQHGGGMLYLVKHIKVVCDVKNLEELKKWWEFLWESYESEKITSPMFEECRLLYNDALRYFPKSYRGESETCLGIYFFDTKGVVRPRKDFLKGRKIGEFSKFINK